MENWACVDRNISLREQDKSNNCSGNGMASLRMEKTVLAGPLLPDAVQSLHTQKLVACADHIHLVCKIFASCFMNEIQWFLFDSSL